MFGGDVYAILLSRRVNKLCMPVTVITVTSLPALGGVCLHVTGPWHGLTHCLFFPG